MAHSGTVNLGDYAKDSLTGFEGVVVGITQWLNSCRHIGIKPTALDKDGRVPATEWFDEPQVVVLSPGHFLPDPLAPLAPGGPVPSGLA
jgi:hypothetical protein